MARMVPNNKLFDDPNLGEKYFDTDPATPYDDNERTFTPPLSVPESNDTHDRAHGNPRHWARIRSGWVAERLMPTRELTDKIIAFRRKQGYFSDAHKEAIRELIRLKNANRRADER